MMLLFKIETNYSPREGKNSFFVCFFLFIFPYFKPLITFSGGGIQPVDCLYIQTVLDEALVKKASMG